MLGLTGGIGAGKSTVARMFAARGAVVIDADEVAREVVEPGGPAYDAVVGRFGRGVVQADGTIDRAALADVVFEDESARAALNAIVHPAVAGAIGARIATLAATPVAMLAATPVADAVVVVEVPLLVEAGWTADKVVVVEAPEREILRRLVDGRAMTDADARRRMSVQATPAERRARADYVIDNGGPPGALAAQVDHVWAEVRRQPAQGG